MKKYLYYIIVGTGMSLPYYAFAGNFDPPPLISIMASSSDGVAAIISDFLPWAILIISIIIGFGLIGWLIHHFGKALHHN